MVSYNKMPLITHYSHLVTNTNKTRSSICTLNLIYFNLGEHFNTNTNKTTVKCVCT